MSLGADPLELAFATRLPIAAHEAERDAEIHQLDGGQEFVRRLLHLPELIEELVRAARAMMEGRHQGLARPAAGGAPGRVQHQIVDTGTECVVRRPQHLHGDASVAGLALEGVQVLHGAFAQRLRVRRAAHRAQTAEQLQQRRRGDRQG